MEQALRLETRAPFDASWVFAFLRARAVPGLEAVDGDGYARSVLLPGGPAVLRVTPAIEGVTLTASLAEAQDLGAAVAATRRLLDLDHDPLAADALLGADPALAPLVAARPGLRAPGAVATDEIAVRALLGQQVSVRAARTLAARLVERLGERLEAPAHGVTHRFPTAAAIAGSDPSALAMPRSRAHALVGLCAALAAGTVRLDPADPAGTRAALEALPGIGPWTAGYVAMRALGDRDAWLGSDLGVRHGLAALPTGVPIDPERWRPYRTYAVHHLWASLPG